MNSPSRPHPLMQILLLAASLLFASSSRAVEIGDLAPDFDLQTMDGTPWRLADYRGKKAVYLIFCNTWCSYCIEKTPRYTKLQEQFADRVEIIAVNTTWSDSKEEIEQFQQRFGLNYPVAMDNGEVLSKRYAVSGVPTEFIIDINGVVRYRDGVPEYIAAHIPDWVAPYSADMNPVQACLK